MSRRSYRGRRRWENPWVSYALIVTVPMMLVLLIVGISALPPYTPSSRAAARPEPSSTASPPAPTTSANATAGEYEAEDATHNTLGRTIEVRALAGASGGEVVTRTGHGTPAGDVKFNAVRAAEAGTFTLTVSYVNDGTSARRLALWVNGHGPAVLSFPPVPAGKIGTLRTSIGLRAGTNTIRFSNATASYGPDLDRITVEPR
jgi:hypothetical protein